MRVSTSAIYEQLSNQVEDNANRLQELQAAISTGRRDLTLSSAPLEYVNAVMMEGSIGRMEDLIRKAESYQSYLNQYDSVFSSLSGQLKEVKSIAMQALNSSTDAEQKVNFASQVNLILQRCVDLANTNFNGDYIFSGSQVDQQAFLAEKNGDAITAVTYQGDNKKLIRSLGTEEKIEISMSGEKVFSGPANRSEDLFATLIELREALSSNDNQAISDNLAKLDGSLNRLIGFRMEVGTKSQHLENSLDSMKSLKLKLEADLGNLRGVDMAKALMDLSLQEVAYQASLQMASRLSSMNILEIFR